MSKVVSTSAIDARFNGSVDHVGTWPKLTVVALSAPHSKLGQKLPAVKFPVSICGVRDNDCNRNASCPILVVPDMIRGQP